MSVAYQLPIWQNSLARKLHDGIHKQAISTPRFLWAECLLYVVDGYKLLRIQKCNKWLVHECGLAGPLGFLLILNGL